MKTRVFLIAFVILFLQAHLCGQEYSFLEENGGLAKITADNGINEPVTIRVIYDNYTHDSLLKADWGYSILVEGLEKKILFDVGARAGVFESNFNIMGIDAAEIDYLVFSHQHDDHTGGLPAFMQMEKDDDLSVLIPYSFSEKFKKQFTGHGMKPLMVKSPATICENLFTSGEFDYPIAEQALVINTKKGLVVLTGCSHPGIIRMLTEIKTKFGKNIYMVIGGFHLLEESDSEINEIIGSMKDMGIVKCGPTHCTGQRQMQIFHENFGENYVELGAGNTIIID